MLLKLPPCVALPLHPLQRQRLDVGMNDNQRFHRGHQLRPGCHRREGRRSSQPDLHHRVNRTQVDARRRIIFADVPRVHPLVPVERRQSPSPRMVDSQIAQQAGAALHALHELFGKLAHFVVRQAGNTQAFDCEGDIDRDLALPWLIGLRRDVQRLQERRQACRRSELQQQQTAVIEIRIAL